MSKVDPNEFIITRKRKKYKFARYHNNPLCFELEEWKGQPSPNMLEVGAGTALFSVAYAKTHPDTQVLAVDVKADRLQTGAYQALGSNMQNVRFLRARADQLRECIKPKSLKAVWITFPDPFPKDRDAKHRLMYSSFLAVYADLLAPDGRVYFKTDAHVLFEWSLEQLVENQWKICELSFDLHESNLPNEYKVMTTYESRFVAEGLPTCFVSAQHDSD